MIMDAYNDDDNDDLMTMIMTMMMIMITQWAKSSYFTRVSAPSNKTKCRTPRKKRGERPLRNLELRLNLARLNLKVRFNLVPVDL